jgi:cytochrome-b5 reductase
MSSGHSALSPAEFRPVILESVTPVSASGEIRIFTFRFTDPTCDAAECKAGQYIALKATIDGVDVERFYSPISCPSEVGHLQLLIKVDSNGCMSHYLNSLIPNESAVLVKGPIAGYQFNPATVNKIGLVACGTGLAPMVQIAREILAHKEMRDRIDVHFLYSALQPGDILLRPELDGYANCDPKFHLTYTVDYVPQNVEWTGRTGQCNKTLLSDSLPAPGPDVQIVVCGPMKAMQCIKQTLLEMGHDASMIYTYG